MSVASKLGALVGLTAFVLLLVSVFTPWYVIRYEFDVSPDLLTYRTDIEFKLDEVASRVYVNGEEISNSSSSYKNSPFASVGDVMTVEFILTALAIPVAAVFVFAAFFGKRTLALICGAVAVALCLVSVIYLPASIEDAVNDSAAELGVVSELLTIEDFSGSKEVLFIDIRWGPSSGWIVAIIAAVLLTVGVLAASRCGRRMNWPQPVG